MATALHSAQPTVTGLVLTLRSAEPVTDAFRARLQAFADFRFGEQNERWLPVSMLSDCPREVHAQIEALPEVAAVDVVFVEIPSEADRPTTPASP